MRTKCCARPIERPRSCSPRMRACACCEIRSFFPSSAIQRFSVACSASSRSFTCTIGAARFRATTAPGGGGGEFAPAIGRRAISFADTRSGVQITLFSLMRPLNPIVLFNGVSDSQTLSSRLGLLNIEAYELTAASTTEAAERQLVDVHGDFGALYHLRSEFLCLIRPDGHVGLVQASCRTPLGNPSLCVGVGESATADLRVQRGA
jgi:hypothetical protein